MTFSRVNPAGWAIGDALTSAQQNLLDTDHTKAIDKTGETAGTGGGVSGTIEFLSGAEILLDSGADFIAVTGSTIALGGGVSLLSAATLTASSGSLLDGTLSIDSTGNLIALSGAHIAINSGGFLTVNTGSPGGLLTVSGTLSFTSASVLSGVVGSGTLSLLGNTLSADGASAIRSTVVGGISIDQVSGLVVTSSSSLLYQSGATEHFAAGSTLQLDSGATLIQGALSAGSAATAPNLTQGAVNRFTLEVTTTGTATGSITFPIPTNASASLRIRSLARNTSAVASSGYADVIIRCDNNAGAIATNTAIAYGNSAGSSIFQGIWASTGSTSSSGASSVFSFANTAAGGGDITKWIFDVEAICI